MLRASRASDGRKRARCSYAASPCSDLVMSEPLPFPELALVPDSRSKPISSRGLRFLCRLGQGGMAEVHLANAAPPNASPNLVVVKRMHQQHVDDPCSMRMFVDEA